MRRALLGCVFALFASAAGAATCSVTGLPVAFGNYGSPNGSQTDTSGTITVTCTPDLILLACRTNYTVSLSTGTAGSYSPRQLASGANRLNYNLYTSATRTTVWGSGAGGTATVAGTINAGILGLICLAGSNDHTVYGRIPASQNVSAGSYGDTITVTVTY
jgi:spore coat protein U-like protein